MRSSNVALRGATYYWRKKITVAGVQMTLSLPLGTGSLKSARAIAQRLGTSTERLQVTYEQRPDMGPEALRKTFNDALREQIRCFWQDAASSKMLPHNQASADTINAEAVGFLARRGVDAPWTLDEDERLINDGWRLADAKSVGFAVFEYQVTNATSKSRQRGLFMTSGAFESTDVLHQMLQAVRAEAYWHAVLSLSTGKPFSAKWVQTAPLEKLPDAFEQVETASSAALHTLTIRLSPEEQPWSESVRNFKPATGAGAGAKMRLLDAMSECIERHEEAGAWTAASTGQVRTALRLFDYACGGDIHIEDLDQRHVTAYSKLCLALPNRWGRTHAEKIGGIAASLARSKKMPAAEIGLGQATINKHITWIGAVLDFAAGADATQGHRPANPLSFKVARAGIGKKARQQRKRDRDKRASWTKLEVARLLSAPIWTGAAGIDQRLKPGTTIIHDAWYWLPLMLPLYGGRSSELAGLALGEVHEHDEIPYLQIDYTEDRGLKTVQSIRKLPIHPELIRLGFIDYIVQIRAAGCRMLFPEMASAKAQSFASTFYKSIFAKWRDWAFPYGTGWRHREGGVWKDKDVHSFRGTATTMLKGLVEDSVRGDIFGHEGETETASTYDEEADLAIKLVALRHLTPLTRHIQPSLPVQIRPANRLRHGVRTPSQPSRLGRPKT